MHASLRGSRAIEAGEVEQNVREHVEFALAGAPAPVGAEHLGTVLEQLGPPERWLPEEERPAWRRVAERILHGPEDWRLAYVSFGVFFLMVVFLPIGGALLLLPAYLVARAHVEIVSERNESLGARRWLVLPPIAILMVIVLSVALVLPIAFATAAGATRDAFDFFGFDPVDRADRMRIQTGIVASLAGAGWILLSAIFALVLPLLQKLFAPFLVSLRRPHALLLTIAGAVLVGIGMWILYAM
ncbi:MAG TPA: hypothetical protein VHK90_12760 [Thermoanaerobaculia bacterium]|nr:hypothetical protein [Thermoanaerobaculia bacterium]